MCVGGTRVLCTANSNALNVMRHVFVLAAVLDRVLVLFGYTLTTRILHIGNVESPVTHARATI